jgi:5-methylcytosine-specific restriction endonuclease McrA
VSRERQQPAAVNEAQRRLDVKRQRDAEYYQRNRDRVLARVKRRTEANRADVLKYQRWYHASEHGRAIARAGRVRNIDRIRARDRLRSSVDTAPPHRIARQRIAAADWARRNPERRAAATMRRYAAKRAAPGSGLTPEQWHAILDRYGHRCLRCGSVAGLEPDHVVPLSKGGAHDPTNIQPLCGGCNRRKATKTIDYRP